MVTEINLTNSDKIVLVDDVDADLSQHNWQLSPQNYAYRCGPRKSGKPNVILMHQLILKRIGHTNFNQVDHEDHNRINNQRRNLRPATNAQNQMRRQKTPGCSSKYKGVSWDKRRGKWQAKIKIKQKQIHLGWYNDEIEAAKRYDKAALYWFKEWALLNFTGDGNDVECKSNS